MKEQFAKSREQIRRAAVGRAAEEFMGATLGPKVILFLILPAWLKDAGALVPSWYWLPICTYIPVSSVITRILLVRIGTQEKEKGGTKDVVLTDRDESIDKRILDALFGNHPIFKNSCRGYLAYRSLIVLDLCLLCVGALFIGSAVILFLAGKPEFLGGFLSNNAHSFLPGLVTAYAVIYWRLKTDHAEKWRFCADKYYQLRPGDELDEANLTLDILRLDQWAKRGFVEFFRAHLERAVKMCSVLCKEDYPGYLHKFQMGQLSEREAEFLLFRYREALENGHRVPDEVQGELDVLSRLREEGIITWDQWYAGTNALGQKSPEELSLEKALAVLLSQEVFTEREIRTIKEKLSKKRISGWRRSGTVIERSHARSARTQMG